MKKVLKFLQGSCRNNIFPLAWKGISFLLLLFNCICQNFVNIVKKEEKVGNNGAKLSECCMLIEPYLNFLNTFPDDCTKWFSNNWQDTEHY